METRSYKIVYDAFSNTYTLHQYLKDGRSWEWRRDTLKQAQDLMKVLVAEDIKREESFVLKFNKYGEEIKEE